MSETKTSTVAIVDDDHSLRRGLSRLLSVLGFSVTAFASGEEFLASGTRHNADCLLLDLNLSGMSGVELKLELERRGPSIPVIFITAQDEEESREMLSRAGNVTCLRKPFSREMLVKAIQQALPSSSLPLARTS